MNSPTIADLCRRVVALEEQRGDVARLVAAARRLAEYHGNDPKAEKLDWLTAPIVEAVVALGGDDDA